MQAELNQMLSDGDRTRIYDFDRIAAPLTVKHFGGMPIGYVNYPHGLGTEPYRHHEAHDVPATISTIPVKTSSGEHRYIACNAHNLGWLRAGKFAVEFESWTPAPDDPNIPRFGRITLTRTPDVLATRIVEAATIVRDALAVEGLRSFAISDRLTELAVWIPVSGPGDCSSFAAWLAAFAQRTAQTHPSVCTTEWLVRDRGNRAFLATHSNYPGTGVSLPYGLRGLHELPVIVPMPWERIADTFEELVVAADFADYIERNGDLFGALCDAIGNQPVPQQPQSICRSYALEFPMNPSTSSYGFIVNAALEILADGKVHSAGDVLERGIALGYFPKTLARESVLAGLHRYYQRAIETNRKPLILQLEGSKFRINRPADDWPAIALDPPPRFIDPALAAAAKAKLTTTATSRDGGAFDVAAAFEIACCDAFALVGFKVQHIGGHGNPDGILDAPLGPRAVRIVLEAKTATPGGVVSNPSPQEPDKFRAAFGAQLAMMIGPAFTGDTNLEQELKTHNVSLWLVDDLIKCLDEQIGPDELLPAFGPGHAADAIADILW
ncbi:MAG: hypothetical protein IAI50_00250, partial [Candidatus Eremiobacteraeota bacterium]|nr:hypothetical protein [Candidatus Eremiobacteraeota bacterium]